MSAAINRSMTPLEWGLLLALSVLWGGSFFFVGVAVHGLPPFSIVALRVGLAACVLWGVVRATGTAVPARPEVWAAFAVMGLLNNVVPFSLIVWGQTQIASGLASILNATTPLFAVVVAHSLTADERMTGARLAGVLIGLAGVVVMMGPDMLGGIGTAVLAQAAILTASVCYAFGGTFGRRFRGMGVSPMMSATGQVTCSALMMVPLAMLVDRPWTLAVPGPEIWLAVIGYAVLSTALAYVLYFRILATAGATNLLLVTFLIPVTAIILGAAFLGERLEPRDFLGMALIGAGLAAIDGRLLRRRAATP